LLSATGFRAERIHKSSSFSEEKEAKRLSSGFLAAAICLRAGSAAGTAQAREVFWFFFSKKNGF
jgi:hypothetical protein